MTAGAQPEDAAGRRRGDSGASRRLACLVAAGGDLRLVFVDGHDDALVGVAFVDDAARVVYDQAAIVRELMRRDGMDREGALEFFEYNIAGAQLGARSPLFIDMV